MIRNVLLLLAILSTVPLFTLAETGQELKAGGKPTPALVTCFAPGPNDNIEGPWATSKPRPESACSDGGGNIPMTLDAVRLKKCKYVTLAANEAFYGRYFYIGTVRYASPIKEADGKGREYVINDVIGYVHDIGPAFRAGSCSRYNTCRDIDRKFDVALGDFRNWNSTNASQFVDKQRFCANYSTTFYQIGGAPVSPPDVTSQIVGRDIAIVPGDPRATSYGPFGLGTQPYTPPSAAVGTQGAYGAAPMQPTSPFALGGATTSASTADFVVSGGRSAVTIIVQPQNVKKGGKIYVSWTSVNMRPASCKVLKNGIEFASGNEATKQDLIEESGTTAYAVECTTAGGEKARSSVSIAIP